MACNHSNTKKVNDIKVCLQCGMSIMPDGKIYFDKDIVNYRPKRRKKQKKG